MRVSEVDYDQIPSPKLHPSMRPSTTNGRRSSALSKSFAARVPTPDPDFDYANPGTFDDFEPPQLNDSPPRSRTPETSPEDAGEDEEAAEVEQAVIAQFKKVDKGKRRADPVEEDEQINPEPYDANGLEDDIAHGLEEAQNAQDDEDDTPPTKKSRKEQAKPKKTRPEKRLIRTPVERAYCEAGACPRLRQLQVPLPQKGCDVGDATVTSLWSGGGKRELSTDAVIPN